MSTTIHIYSRLTDHCCDTDTNLSSLVCLGNLVHSILVSLLVVSQLLICILVLDAQLLSLVLHVSVLRSQLLQVLLTSLTRAFQLLTLGYGQVDEGAGPYAITEVAYETVSSKRNTI